jgi:uncharacterized protein YjdB
MTICSRAADKGGQKSHYEEGRAMNALKLHMKTLLCSVGFLLTAVLAGCGGDQGRDPILGLPAAELSSVTVTPATASVPIGATQQFIATATYADGASKDVTASSTWSTASAGVAGVNASNGLATGMASGSAAISAAFGGKSGAATLTVTPATLLSLAISPLNRTIAIDGRVQYQAMGTFTDGTTRDITAASTFSSATPAFASILPGGDATGVAAGTSVITAQSGALSASTNLTVNSATLSSIAVTPTNGSIAAGTTQQFTATATYSDASTSDVTVFSAWTSGATGVATVASPSGLARGVAPGAAPITATFAGKTDTETLTVTAATVVSLAVTPANASIAIDGEQQFTATATYSDGSTGNVTASAAWNSANTNVATVLQNGVASGVAGGTSVIQAAFGGKNHSQTLTVRPATLTSITVTPANASISVGATQQFTATASYSDGTTGNVTSSANWTSGNAVVATVNNASGVATGRSAGSALVSATYRGRTDAKTLTVTPATVVSLAVTPANASIPVDGVQQYRATATYSDGTSSNVTASSTWNSAITGVASVSQNGLASGVAGGTSLIRATFAGRNASQTLTVRAATLTSIAVTPLLPVMPIGDTQQFIATASYSDGTTSNVTAASSWTSGNLAVATVNNASGVATGRSGGTALITATYKGMNDAETLTVTPALGPAAVILGGAGNFAILAKTGVTNVPTSAVTGNIGSSPISGAFIGITCSEVNGIIYAVDAAGPACAVADPVLLTAAVSDLETAYTDAAGRPAGVGPFLNVGAGTVANQTLVAGTYTWGTNVTIPTNLTLVGGPNDVWIFQVTGKLNISPNMRVILSGGAQAKNIFWQVTGAVTLDTNSHFEGTILAQTNIAMLTGASLNGRTLSQTATTLQQNTVVKPAP